MHESANHVYLSDALARKKITNFQYVANMFVFADLTHVNLEIKEVMDTLSVEELSRLWDVLGVYHQYNKPAALLLLSFGVYPNAKPMLDLALLCVLHADPLVAFDKDLCKRELMAISNNCDNANCEFRVYQLLSRYGWINGIGFENTLLPSYLDLVPTSKSLTQLIQNSKDASLTCDRTKFIRLLCGCTVIYRMLHDNTSHKNETVFSLIDIYCPIVAQTVFLSNNHEQAGFDRLLSLFLGELSRMCTPRELLGTPVFNGYYNVDIETTSILAAMSKSDWVWVNEYFKNLLSEHDHYQLFPLIEAAISAILTDGTIDNNIIAKASKTRVRWD